MQNVQGKIYSIFVWSFADDKREKNPSYIIEILKKWGCCLLTSSSYWFRFENDFLQNFRTSKIKAKAGRIIIWLWEDWIYPQSAKIAALPVQKNVSWKIPSEQSRNHKRKESVRKLGQVILVKFQNSQYWLIFSLSFHSVPYRIIFHFGNLLNVLGTYFSLWLN